MGFNINETGDLFCPVRPEIPLIQTSCDPKICSISDIVIAKGFDVMIGDAPVDIRVIFA